MLPVRLAPAEVDYLFKNDVEIEIDLARQSICAGDRVMHFEIDEFRKKLLLEGLDSIALTLKLESDIARYERERQTFAPSA